MSAEVVSVTVSPEYARALTDKIKVAVEGTWQLIVEAYQSRSWQVLGYASWDDYCTREFGTARLRLPREDRTEQVHSLREAGLSLRAISAATGMSEATTRRDLAPASNDAPDEQMDRGTGEISEPDTEPSPAAPDTEPSPATTGIDGKTYPRPKPKKQPDSAPKSPRRSSLPDQARKAGWDLRKVVERIERLSADDRFNANREAVAPHLRGHLANAVEVCQDLLDRLS